MPPFKELHSFEKRQSEAARIRERFPGRIPVIVERAAKSDVPTLDKEKFLVPGDLTVGQFSYVVRRRLQLPPEKALFLFVQNALPPSSQLMRETYAAHQDKDGFMYVLYAGESTFGR